MSKTVYIARNGQILAALADDDFGVFDVPRPTTRYEDVPLEAWERDGKIAFGEYVGSVLGGGDWEYNGSSSCWSADPDVGMTVAVYESRVTGFTGDELDALVEHRDTVFHGYLEFVDQGTRYSNAVVELADLAEVCPSSKIDKLRIAVGDLLDESREYNDPVSDIVYALRETDWDYDRSVGELIRRMPEVA